MAAAGLEDEHAAGDPELIRRTLQGDHSAFEELVARHQRKIYRVAFAILRNEGDADIVTQDTFVQAYLNLSKFQGRAELETWLTRIAINRSRDALRSRRWLQLPFTNNRDATDPLLIEPVDEEPDAERRAMSRELHTAIERAVSALSDQQKIVFRLRHYEGLQLEEIATLLELRAGTVRAHLFRAVHKVRKELSVWMPGNSSLGGATE
ncbi:MAG TPA: sigma-70 family RNA polymerase sigma factor [Thermoanaerobaculia bacterium]|nr:sigma-70 family RNA polymerase sigma factor [Thermoanaerobaculia bacterium]